MTGDIFGFGPNIIRTPPRDKVSKFTRIITSSTEAYYSFNSHTDYTIYKQAICSTCFRILRNDNISALWIVLPYIGNSAQGNISTKIWLRSYIVSPEKRMLYFGQPSTTELLGTSSQPSNFVYADYKCVLSSMGNRYNISFEFDTWYTLQSCLFRNERVSESWVAFNGVKLRRGKHTSNTQQVVHYTEYNSPYRFAFSTAPVTIDLANTVLYGLENPTIDDGSELANSLVDWNTGDFLLPRTAEGDIVPLINMNSETNPLANIGSIGGTAILTTGSATISLIDSDDTVGLNKMPEGKRRVFKINLSSNYGTAIHRYSEYSPGEDYDFTTDDLMTKKILIVKACQFADNKFCTANIDYILPSTGGWWEWADTDQYGVKGTTASPIASIPAGSGYKIFLIMVTPTTGIHWVRTKTTTYTQSSNLGAQAQPSLGTYTGGLDILYKYPGTESIQPYREVFSGVYTNKMMQDNPQIPWDDPAAMVAYFVKNDKYIKDLSKAISGVTPLVLTNSSAIRAHPCASSGTGYFGFGGTTTDLNISPMVTVETIDDPFVT